MSTTVQLACGVVALAITLTALGLQLARLRRRRRTEPSQRVQACWALILSAAPGHLVQCPVPTCGHPVDVMRGHHGGEHVTLEPCGHTVDREQLRTAVGG